VPWVEEIDENGNVVDVWHGKWKPTPQSRLIHAKRYDPKTGEWMECAYADLKAGDIFRSFASDGTPIDPYTFEPTDDDDVVAFAHADAMKNRYRNEGFAVEISTGSLDEIMAMVRN
jgi:hypothetical protein